MEKTTDASQITNGMQLLPKYIQALHHDIVVYFAGEESLSTTERQSILLKNIKLIEDVLMDIKKIVTSGTTNT